MRGKLSLDTDSIIPNILHLGHFEPEQAQLEGQQVRRNPRKYHTESPDCQPSLAEFEVPLHGTGPSRAEL